MAFKLSTVFSGVPLVAFSSIVGDASARLVASSDIRENIKESKSFAKSKGEECIKFETDISNKKEDTENVDVGVLGCGEALICLEDNSSSTGARCVDFVEADEGVSCRGASRHCSAGWCCEGLTCLKIQDSFHDNKFQPWQYGQCVIPFEGGDDDNTCTAAGEYCVNWRTYEKYADCCDGTECQYFFDYLFGGYGSWICD